MVEFVRLHKLTSKGATNIRDFKKNLDEFRKLQEEMGVKIIASYACLGEYDFVSIINAPDDESAFKLSVVLGEKGNISTVTMKAMKTDEFAEMTSNM
ncbi:MAG: GYD domain-containing protein [Candidatus Hydrothermarchaeales archaeon]